MAEVNVGRLADASSRAAAAPPPAMPSAAAITAPTITATTPTKIARRDVTASFRLSRVEITSAKIAGTAAGGSSRNAVRPGVTSQRSAMAVQADEPVSPPSFVGCYQLNESTDILPARFALRADSAGGNLFDVRYVDSLGRATERILDAGWVIEGGRVVVKTVRRGTILSMSLADGAVTAESVNGPRAGRVTGCR